MPLCSQPPETFCTNFDKLQISKFKHLPYLQQGYITKLLSLLNCWSY